jgi:hypothetical protein
MGLKVMHCQCKIIYQWYPATGGNFGFGPTLRNSPFKQSCNRLQMVSDNEWQYLRVKFSRPESRKQTYAEKRNDFFDTIWHYN